MNCLQNYEKKMNINIKGVEKDSMIDYPGKISCVVFLSRCNFRCGFCHNPELIFNESEFPDITPEEFLTWLGKRKKWLDGVVITGGEPTLHIGLIDFIKAIKELGLCVKLDTNGTNPSIVQKVIDEKLVDYIAMDIKNSLDKYNTTTSSNVNTEKIRESAKIIMDAGSKELIDYEFRTTIHPRFHNAQDFEKISSWLKGSKKYVLQQFRGEHRIIDETLKNEDNYNLSDLEKFKNIIGSSIEIVEIR